MVGWCPGTGEVARLDAIDERDRDDERARWVADGFVEVPRPDGLTEWRWRSEFVRLRVSEPTLKKRLGRMLRAGKGRFGFERALALHPGAQRAFAEFRRHQLIDFVTEWLRDGADPPRGDAGAPGNRKPMPPSGQTTRRP